MNNVLKNKTAVLTKSYMFKIIAVLLSFAIVFNLAFSFSFTAYAAPTKDELEDKISDVQAEREKQQALLDIATMAKVIENESNIETLVKAKGFEECVAVINGEKASVIVKSEGLQPNHLSQILEIVYLQAGILPENVTIMEK